ncbi:MAG: histidine phosphatase family protein [Armatimonadota bacterium]|nr:histidine phosphatase family protein [Armatimonadota bacterium]MCX7776708.1 histidine phosphatase family protein [Armatimonadota bacterium]MDW8026654.1 histidine phosphatase family protein [Armatimonadota bacterium]
MRRTTIILVRHGETLWNRQRRFQGQRDVPLSELGRLQAAALQERLKGEQIDTVYASDLSRASETAQIILQGRSVEINLTLELRERHKGAWEGLTFEEAAKAYPKEIEAWLKDPLASVPYGESGDQFILRVKGFIERTLSFHSGERMLIVSHGGPIKVAICLMLGWDMSCLHRFRISNGSISIIEMNSGSTVCNVLNDECYLHRLK